MHTKTMEGLIGARTNMNMTQVPMRVFKEARRKGDTATMERAMGYVNDFEDKAYDYKDKAADGMKEEAKEAREKEKRELEEAIEKSREECKQAEEQAAAETHENHSQLQAAPSASPSKTDGIKEPQATETGSEIQENSPNTAIQPPAAIEISLEGRELSNQSNHSTPSQTPGAKLDNPVFYSSAGTDQRIAQNNTPALNVLV